MTQPIKNSLIESPQTVKQPAAQKVFKMPDLLSQIFKGTQERNNSLINKASNRGSQILVNSPWQEIRRAATTNHPAGPTEFQKTHPTLSSFIQSNQIKNRSQLVAHLRKEAKDLALTGTEIFRTFKTSLASKDILALDALIEQMNLTRVENRNCLYNLVAKIGLQKGLNYKAWNEAVQALDITTITDLDLEYCYLTRIPYGILQFRNLQEISLHHNQLAALPPEIWQLQNLQSLDLGHNQLATLPKEVEQLQNLQALALYNNQLAALPKEVGHLQNLKGLFLNNNQLAALSQEIGQLQNLQELTLENNQLAALPESFARLIPQLETGSNEIERLVEAGRKAGTLEKKS